MIEHQSSALTRNIGRSFRNAPIGIVLAMFTDLRDLTVFDPFAMEHYASTPQRLNASTPQRLNASTPNKANGTMVAERFFDRVRSKWDVRANTVHSY
jgi:hypothetical protein